MGFRKEVEDWVRGWGLRRRYMSSLDRPWEGLAVVMRLETSELNVGVGS